MLSYPLKCHFMAIRNSRGKIYIFHHCLYFHASLVVTKCAHFGNFLETCVSLLLDFRGLNIRYIFFLILLASLYKVAASRQMTPPMMATMTTTPMEPMPTAEALLSLMVQSSCGALLLTDKVVVRKDKFLEEAFSNRFNQCLLLASNGSQLMASDLWFLAWYSLEKLLLCIGVLLDLLGLLEDTVSFGTPVVCNKDVCCLCIVVF